MTHSAWILIVWFGTFAGPFTVTGNGYFAAWLGCSCASLIFMAEDDTRELLFLLCCAPCCKRLGACAARKQDPSEQTQTQFGDSRMTAVPAEVVVEMDEDGRRTEKDSSQPPPPAAMPSTPSNLDDQ